MSTAEELKQIPHATLVNMLKSLAWCSGNRTEFGQRQGYSFDVTEETALRDVLYRDFPLYKTPEEALLAYWRRHYCA